MIPWFTRNDEKSVGRASPPATFFCTAQAGKPVPPNFKNFSRQAIEEKLKGLKKFDFQKAGPPGPAFCMVPPGEANHGEQKVIHRPGRGNS